MYPEASLCREQEALQRARAISTPLPNVRAVAERAAAAWGIEAVSAEKREFSVNGTVVVDRLEGALDASLDVDPEGLLDRDDVGGVRERRLGILAARAADDLVDAVEDGEAGDLAGAGM